MKTKTKINNVLNYYTIGNGRLSKAADSKLNVFLIMGLLVVSLFLNLNLVLAAESFGGGVPTSFSGDNYRVYGASINPQFTQPSFYGGYDTDILGYWGNFNKEDCRERQDVILMIPPGGCSPSVVRSDLLEEQDVPVFCKVSSIQVNPLIDITKIRSIHFKGGYPEGVAGMSYFPARIAVRSDSKLIGSPIVDNVGYLVIKLKKTANEKNMLDWIGGNVTAVVDYDSEGVFGVGEHDFYLTETDDEEWQGAYKDYGFWKGKGYIRLESLDEDSARISIYRDAVGREASVDIKKGETSRDIYLGGYYCAAGMNIKLEDVGDPVDVVLLRVDDEEMWLGRGSEFLDGRCRISNLEIYDVGGGKASFICTGAGKFDLILKGASANLKVGDSQVMEFDSGDFVSKSGDGKNIYVGYVGKNPKENSNFVLLIKTGDDEISFQNRMIGSIVNRAVNRYSSSSIIGKRLRNVVGGFDDYIREEIRKKHKEIPKEDIIILRKENSIWENIKLESTFVEGDILKNELLKENYENSVKNYEEVFNLYPSEKERLDDDNLDPYAVEALSNAADLSKILGLQSKQIGYLEKLIENYPNTKLANDAEIELERVYKSRFSANSQGIVYINNEPHFISLMDMKKPSYEDLGAELLIIDKGETRELEAEKGVLEITEQSQIPFRVKEIGEDYVEIGYTEDLNWIFKGINAIRPETIDKTKKIEIGKTEQITSRVSIRLVDTNLNKMAKVKIIPKDFGMRTESDFEFKIGIEKRGIKLSPEKTQEMITNLEKNIKNWEDINEKLGKVVTGLKGACFATSAVLVVKNFFSGLSGEAMARNEVMTMKGGWNDKCRIAYANKENICGKGIPSSIQKCLLDCNDKINTAVNQYTEIIKQENELMKKIENLPGIKQEGDILDWQGQVDQEKLKQEYCRQSGFVNWYNSNKDTLQIEIKGEEKQYLNKIIDPSKVTSEKCDVDLEDMKMLMLKKKISEGSYDSALVDVIDNKLKNGLVNTYNINRLTVNQGIVTQTFGNISVFSEEGKKRYQVMSDVKNVRINGGIPSFGSEITKVFGDIINNKKVVVGLSNKEGDTYVVSKILDENGNDISNTEYTKDGKGNSISYKEYYSYYKNIDEFTIVNSNYYNYKFKEKVKVKYYERAPYKGLPAQVPIGKVGQTDGWYVTSDYILSGFGKPYEESGRAANFWICNVGENGLIDGKSRDDCRYYNLGSSADLKFPGLSSGESAILVSRAERAIREASSQYGKSKVTINNQVYETEIAENGESGNCADFMSPSDCNLMFNVCDPVMCPESRCDYGGKYRVDNVVQSGIIGSLLLCLPNAQEGVMVPICLSGVHAGIEGYLSILKSTKDCLNESLATGRNIGICDEIKSIYMCEFFWRQAAPLMDVFIPNIFEAFLGQGARGGGEYLTIDYAWKNVQNSIDYFKNEYAVNAMKAFNDRSTAGVGEEVCKSFVSATYPSGNLIDNLLEPDSPVQYTAWFSENVLTEATIPPTSHYKVYYHIYAGKDIGAHYVVYLANPPASSMVHTLGTYVVGRGYIEKGQQVDIARDFTGVAGYQELCISINGQDECGFKQVSTSWAVNELANQYAVEQASQTQITKASECVAGEPSIYSLANPNLQAGAQETISPELYKRGVIRVCSSENPGKSVDPNTGQIDPTNSSYDRWVRVGDCDTSAVGCWLDTRSVENVLSDAPGLLNETLDKVKLDYVDKLEGVTPEQIKTANTNADKLLGEIDKLDTASLNKTNIIMKIGSVIDNLKAVAERGGASNPQKAKALLRIGQIYDEIARKIHEEVMKAKTGVAEETQPKEEGRIYFKENLAVGFWPIVNNLTFAKYQINLIETKFVKSIDGTTLYYTTDRTEDKLGGTWRLADSKQMQIYDSGKDFLSEEFAQTGKVRIKVGSWIKSSSPEVLIDSYVELNVNGIKTKFVKGVDENSIYTSTNFEVNKFEGYWKKANSDELQVYLSN